MKTPISLFDYELPELFIAQKSVEPKDHSRLLVLDRKTGEMEHKHFFEIKSFLKPGDVLVFNQTKVFKARLEGGTEYGKKNLEVFLLREKSGFWDVLLKPARRINVGENIYFDDGFLAEVKDKKEDGVVVLDFQKTKEEVLAYCSQYGEVPIPPYVEKTKEALENYQTVYAKNVGAVAAPTAGFHFTERLLNELKEQGIQTEFITLHVGLGTFRPVKTETLEEHEMHAEFVEIDAGTSERINQAKKDGRRVIAVGTTVVRALEGTEAKPFMGDVNIFIMPGYKFKIIDGLITNFHLPKSTLLALVSALAGREHILAAYEEAKRLGYRFYSFGDAMLIV